MQETSAFEDRKFDEWFAPFSTAFGHKGRQRWAPVYLRGLIYPGERKSIEPLAGRVAPGEYDQLHHFVAVSEWECAPLEKVLLDKADEMLGGEDAHLIIDDTALPKKGTHSVGVAHQYCGQLGKQANCQALVSVTLAREEIPVPVALRLYMPESWCSDPTRRKKAKVPEEVIYRPKWKIALELLDRANSNGVKFRWLTFDEGYGGEPGFLAGLRERRQMKIGRSFS